MRITAVLVLCALSLASAIVRAEDELPLADKYLSTGELERGEKDLEARLKQKPDDDQARFGLAVIQFVRSIEHLSQSFYRYGLYNANSFRELPFVRMPLPENPNPAECGYEDTRRIMQDLLADLGRSQKTLEGIQGDNVKLPLRFGRVRLDFDGDGKSTDDEVLYKLYNRMNAAAGITPQSAEAFVIALDKADVHWLRGYCHLLSAMAEMSLAYDARELFERAGHLFFPKAKSPYGFLQEGKKVFQFGGNVDIADLIAMVHLLNFPLKEPDRLKSALAHLEQVIACSRESWNAIMTETDDDHEWIPSPKQTGVIPGVKITPQMVDGWLTFLIEADSLLKGDLLIPFWRGSEEGVGVNLRKVFTEPRPFDLVLWVQGTGAAPYLEQGEVSTRATWDRLYRVFGGEFLGFALWFN